MGDINKNVNLTFTTKDKASAGLKAISKEMEKATQSTKDFSTQSSNLTSYSSSLAKNFNSLSESSKSLNKQVGSIIPSLTKLAAGYLSVTTLAKGAYNIAVEGIAAYKESIEVEAQLTRVIGYKSQALEEYAKAMQKKSVYDDDAIKSAMAQAGAFIKNEQAMKKVIAAAMDLASGRGMDLSTATDLITKSISSGTNALSRYGIEMDKTADKSKRLSSLSGSIQGAYGGAAAAEAGTESGKQKQLINDINNLKEDIGKAVLPIQTDVLRAEKFLLQSYNSTKTWFDDQVTNQTSFMRDFTKSMDNVLAMGGDAAKRSLVSMLPSLEGEITKTEQKIDDFRKKYAAAEYKNDEIKMRSLDARMQKEKGYLNELVNIRHKISKIKVEPISDTDLGEDPDAKAKREEEFAKKRKDAQTSLNDELFKIDQESLSKTFEGKLKALDYSLTAEKEKYKKQYADKLIDLEQYYQIALALDNKYLGLKDELIKEEKDRLLKSLQEQLDARSESVRRAYEIEKSISEQTESGRLSLRATFEDRQKELAANSLSGRLDLAKEATLDEIALYQFMLDQKIISQEEYNSLSLDIQKEHNDSVTEEWISAIDDWSNKYMGAASTVMSYVMNINSLLHQDDISKIDEQTAKNKDAANKYIKNKKQLQKELDKIDKEAENKKKEAAKTEQKLSMIASIINTAQAVSGALTMKPPPLGIAMAIIVGALGAVQTGIIASQAFAQGGIVQPEQGVPTSGDKTQVSVNPGEMILNQRQQKNLLTMANGYGGGSGVSINETIIVQGNMDSNAIAELKQHREEWLEMLRDSNKQLKYRGYTYAT